MKAFQDAPLKLYLVTIAVVAVSLGVAGKFLLLAVRKQREIERAQWWLSARGRILESTIYKDPSSGHDHFRIRYEFSAGEIREGSRPRIAGDWFWTDQLQAAYVARYSVDQEVEVFYDPNDPERNCLDRDDRSGILVMWAIVVLLFSIMAGSSCFLFYLFAQRAR